MNKYSIILINTLLVIMTLSFNVFGNTELTQEKAKHALERLYIPYDEPTFYKAIYNNDKVITNLFLLSGMSPNFKFSVMKEITPLILASYRNNVELVKLLIEKGADINYMYPIEQNNERTALYYSIQKLNYEICKLLLEKGAHTYYINNNKIYKGKELLERMITKNQYASAQDDKSAQMDKPAKEKALKILELLKQYSDNDLITLTGKVFMGPKGWTFEPADKASQPEGYRLGDKLPDMLKKILEQAKDQNTQVTLIGEPDRAGYFYINKIKLNEKLHTVPNYHGSN
jgi:ankyrin repeat protein